MKKTTAVALAIAATLGFGSVAQAQPDRGRGDGPRAEQRGNDRNEARRDTGDPRDAFGRQPDNNRRDVRDARDGRNRSFDRQNPDFRRGGRVPQEYRSRQYVVNDWRGHRLSAPPRGHQWVQVGADYVLVAVATGIIANLILNQ